MEKRYCECGCGSEITLHTKYSSSYKKRGLPRFIRGHQIRTNVVQDKIRNTLMGHSVSLKTRKKISCTLRGIKMKDFVDFALSSSEKIRKSKEYDEWRRAVFERDDYTCQVSGKKGCKLEAHHISNFSNHRDLILELDNGITLSRKYHILFHRIFGCENNNNSQLERFKRYINDGIDNYVKIRNWEELIKLFFNTNLDEYTLIITGWTQMKGKLKTLYFSPIPISILKREL